MKVLKLGVCDEQQQQQQQMGGMPAPGAEHVVLPQVNERARAAPQIHLLSADAAGDHNHNMLVSAGRKHVNIALV